MPTQKNIYDTKRDAFLSLSHTEKVQIVLTGLRQIEGHPSIDTILSALDAGMDMSDERLTEIYIALLMGQYASSEVESAEARSRLESVRDDMLRIRAQEQSEKEAERAQSDTLIASVMI